VPEKCGLRVKTSSRRHKVPRLGRRSGREGFAGGQSGAGEVFFTASPSKQTKPVHEPPMVRPYLRTTQNKERISLLGAFLFCGLH
jgi:hypothetical protein